MLHILRETLKTVGSEDSIAQLTSDLDDARKGCDNIEVELEGYTPLLSLPVLISMSTHLMSSWSRLGSQYVMTVSLSPHSSNCYRSNAVQDRMHIIQPSKNLDFTVF